MAIHTISDTNPNSPKQTGGNASAARITEFEVPELQRTLKLAGLLQTSLEVENILQFFVDSIVEITPFGGVEYAYTPLDIKFKSGKSERHSCAYRLRIAGDDLGEIKFTRNKRFTEQEMESLENTIFHLVYPLRNSLQYQKAVKAAQMDALTGIYNRAAMDRSLEREVELSHRLDNQLSLLIVDVDHFKAINDNYGHSAGDAVLKSMVTCINDTMRVSDIMFRYGGEEFALILAGTGMDGARQVGERIRAAVAAYPFVYNGKEMDLTVSIGVASLGRRDSAKRLFNKADTALYQAKKAGRNQVHGSNEG
ncbi:MAG: GGDEF domain-containing protein [Gammaproteobacteria bacterium]|nr:GGDEF domain-containing protein [Gammaproteobacteria bacterium]